MVERSASARPDWISLTPTVTGYKHFVGYGEDTKTQSAKDAAVSDMLKRYAENLGVDFSVLVQVHQEEI